jgi:hypothetical protein
MIAYRPAIPYDVIPEFLRRRDFSDEKALNLDIEHCLSAL